MQNNREAIWQKYDILMVQEISPKRNHKYTKVVQHCYDYNNKMHVYNPLHLLFLVLLLYTIMQCCNETNEMYFNNQYFC